MAITLRQQNEQERNEGRTQGIVWQDDDYAVLDGETKIGRIYRERVPARKWTWFLYISGAADSLDEAKAELIASYERNR